MIEIRGYRPRIIALGLLTLGLMSCSDKATPTAEVSGVSEIANAVPVNTQALPGGAKVCFYEDINYSGNSFCSNLDSSLLNAQWNDRVSSVRLAQGVQVQLFVDRDYKGKALTLKADTSNLVTLGFNDLASSYKISATGTTPPKCVFQVWKENTNYQLGNIVLYQPNTLYYKVVNTVNGGTDMTNPVISTYYWAPTTCDTAPPPVVPPPVVPPPVVPPPVVPPPPSGSGGLVGTYYATFAGAVPRLKDIDPNYNLVYMFAATKAGGEPLGTLKFSAPPDGNGAWTNWVADLQYARSVQKRKMILSVGGAGEAIGFTDRTISTTFVNSVDKLYNDWKGFDGLDFNTFEADAAPNTPELIWIGEELKRRHPGFLITAPPAPWNKVDQQFCKDMLDAGALDYCAPQYYDGPNLSDPTFLLSNVKIWMDLLGPSHVLVGFGINNELTNYWKIDSAVNTFKQLKAQYPAVKGVFDWRLDWDVAQGYPFAKQFAPLVK